MIANVLSIAGSDPSGGAGVQADLKTFFAHGCYGMAAVTALTVQNTQGVRAVETLAPAFVAAQVAAVFDDIRVDAVKIGMLASGAIARAVAAVLAARARCPLVLDPVLVATSGDTLATPDLIEGLHALYPLATLVTPNLPEAEALGASLIPAEAAAHLHAGGARAVLIKGGHAAGDMATDTLFVVGTAPQAFSAPKRDTRNTHGTGCTLASAIAAHLARGVMLADAVALAKAYVGAAIAAADGLAVGHGHGPLHHGVALPQTILDARPRTA